MVADAAEKRAFLKNRTSSIGDGFRHSQSAKAVMKMIPTPSAIDTTGDDQPLSGPSMIPYKRKRNPTIENNAPPGSRGLSARSLVFGTNRHAKSSAAAQMGRLTRNPDRQRSFTGIPKGVGQNRQCRRKDEGPTDPHQPAGRDELRRRADRRSQRG